MKHQAVVINLIVLYALCVGGLAGAQTVYRIVGPGGKVTFSDKAPQDAAKTTAANASSNPQSATEAGLPYELRQIASRFPVTLYTGAACAPCNSGRLLLQGRGIPFFENTVITLEDIEALKRISGDSSLPFLTIGGQKIKGFSETEWVQFLDAASYPATSVLPSSYRSSPPRPLVMAQKPSTGLSANGTQASGDEKSVERDPGVAQPLPASNLSNPTGIKF